MHKTVGDRQMRKTASYIFLALLAIVGLGSVYQIDAAADIIGKANDDVAKAKADMAKRANSVDYESSASPVDPSYGESSDAAGVESEPEIPFESGSGAK